MSHEVIWPPFDKTTYSQACKDLLDDADQWEDWPDYSYATGHDWVSRGYKLDQAPYRYWIREFGIEMGSQERGHRVLHTMFWVAMLAMESTADGRRTVHQWFLWPDITGRQEYIDYVSMAVSDENVALQYSFDNPIQPVVERDTLGPSDDTDLLELTWAVAALQRGTPPTDG